MVGSCRDNECFRVAELRLLPVGQFEDDPLPFDQAQDVRRSIRRDVNACRKLEAMKVVEMGRMRRDMNQLPALALANDRGLAHQLPPDAFALALEVKILKGPINVDRTRPPVQIQA